MAEPTHGDLTGKDGRERSVAVRARLHAGRKAYQRIVLLAGSRLWLAARSRERSSSTLTFQARRTSRSRMPRSRRTSSSRARGSIRSRGKTRHQGTQPARRADCAPRRTAARPALRERSTPSRCERPYGRALATSDTHRIVRGARRRRPCARLDANALASTHPRASPRCVDAAALDN